VGHPGRGSGLFKADAICYHTAGAVSQESICQRPSWHGKAKRNPGRGSVNMSDLLQRLLYIARSHLNDVIDLRRFRPRIDPLWERAFDGDDAYESTHRASGDHTSGHADTSSSSGPTFHADSGLPYSPELVRSYALLDLPFGAPMEQVSRRWKTYLKTCHPDRFAKDPARQADATELTQALTGAHDTIRAAWKRRGNPQP
jgi:hypothetical protein